MEYEERKAAIQAAMVTEMHKLGWPDRLPNLALIPHLPRIYNAAVATGLLMEHETYDEFCRAFDSELILSELKEAAKSVKETLGL